MEPDLVEMIDRYHRSIDAFLRGDTEPQKRLYSRGDDATLANPLGPPARGWRDVEALLDRSASLVRDGEPSRYERVSAYATHDIGYVLELERARARFGGSDGLRATSLRVTTVFRREGRDWKIVHRHADPITTPRSVESLFEP